MKWKFVLWLFSILIFVLTACGAPSGGPQAWLDRPLDNTTIPFAPFIIQAHASDSNGVASFEFYVDDTLLSAVNGSGGRLSEASIEWTPSKPGIYTIKARAADNQGKFGPTTRAQIIVNGTANLATETPVPAPISPQCAIGALVAPILLSPADGSVLGTEPLFAWAYPNKTCHPYSYRIDISEDASFADVGWGFGTLDYNETSRQWPLPAGQCYYWRVRAYAPDDYGPASPVWTFCIDEPLTAPTFTPTLTLTACKPTITANVDVNVRAGPASAYNIVGTLAAGQSANLLGQSDSSFGTWWYIQYPGAPGGYGWVWGDLVSAVCIPQNLPVVSAPPLPITNTPILTITPTLVSSPVPDTSPPNFIGAAASPDEILTKGNGCSSYPRTTNVEVHVVDVESTVANVWAVWGVGAESGQTTLSAIGGDYYQGTVGPVNTAGTLNITVYAQDTTGNTARSSTLYINVQNCVQ